MDGTRGISSVTVMILSPIPSYEKEKFMCFL